MQTSKNEVFLYNTREEIRASAPYATEDADELEQVISRFFAWTRMMGLYPDMAAKYGTAHIRLATDLRAAVRTSRENHLYTNIVLPMNKYFSTKLLSEITQAAIMKPAFTDMMERESQKWGEEYPVW